MPKAQRKKSVKKCQDKKSEKDKQISPSKDLSSENSNISENETQITILNKDIEQLRSITIAIINNQNNQNNKIKDKKNSSFLIERYYKPYFLSGMHKYVERGDTITIGDLEIFVLKCSPKSGYVINSTKCILKYGKTKEQCIERINNEIERERES